MSDDILLYSEFACGIILLFCAIIQLMYKNKQFINYNLAGLYFCVAYVILTLWFLNSGMALWFPCMLYTDISTGFAIGPFAYFYIKALLGKKTVTDYRYGLHFIPAAISFISIIAYNACDRSLVHHYSQNNTGYPVYGLSPFISIIDFASNAFVLAYLVAAAVNIYPVLRNRQHKSFRELDMVFRYLAIVIIFALMMLVSGMLHNEPLLFISIHALALSGIWYFIFSYRHPDFTQKAIKEAKTIRYQDSILNGIDTDVILERLNELMKYDKVYLDPDLTLQKLSDELLITSHQLSKLLNTEHKKNFRTLINSYRTEEAKSLMEKYPDRNVLDIALESGFNSKSSFNTIFARETGITPREYRKQFK